MKKINLTDVTIGIIFIILGLFLTFKFSLWWIILIIVGIVGVTEAMEQAKNG